MKTVVKKLNKAKPRRIAGRKARTMPKASGKETLSFEKVWKMFQEEKEMFQKTREQNREDYKMLTEKFRETDKKFQETDKNFQETKEQMRDTDKKIKELSGLFTTQWGKLVEALLGNGCVALFKDRGIKINVSGANMKGSYEGRIMEVDVLLVNGTEVVFIEVKTTAKVAHVKELLEDLKEFKKFFTHYKDCTIYGGLAALKFEEESNRYAASKGLFVIEPAGEGVVRIQNPGNFVPKGF